MISDERLDRILKNLDRYPENWKFARRNLTIRQALIRRFCKLMGFKEVSER